MNQNTFTRTPETSEEAAVLSGNATSRISALKWVRKAFTCYPPSLYPKLAELSTAGRKFSTHSFSLRREREAGKNASNVRAFRRYQDTDFSLT